MKKPKPLSTFEKLAIKIKKDLGYDVVDIKRTYVGIHMKASGAQVWRGKLKSKNINHRRKLGLW